MGECTMRFRSGPWTSRATRLVVVIAVLATVLGVSGTSYATSVTNASVTLSTPNASASAVEYSAGFTATSGLVGGTGTITLNAAPGTVFTDGVPANVVDQTNGANSGGTFGGSVDPATPNKVVFTLGTSVTAGHKLLVVVDDVTNPAT